VRAYLKKAKTESKTKKRMKKERKGLGVWLKW
jgi:hypothetical protein